LAAPSYGLRKAPSQPRVCAAKRHVLDVLNSSEVP
jgi:hypothetical protein